MGENDVTLTEGKYQQSHHLRNVTLEGRVDRIDQCIPLPLDVSSYYNY